MIIDLWNFTKFSHCKRKMDSAVSHTFQTNFRQVRKTWLTIWIGNMWNPDDIIWILLGLQMKIFWSLRFFSSRKELRLIRLNYLWHHLDNYLRHHLDNLLRWTLWKERYSQQFIYFFDEVTYKILSAFKLHKQI